MGLRQAVGRLLARISVPQKPGASWYWFGRYGAPRVTTQTANSLAAVYGCCRFITGNISQLPWRIYQKETKGSRELSEHPAYWVLSVRANPEMSAFNFRTLMLFRALLLGNGYAEIERDTAGRIKWLWPIENDRVTPDRDEAGNLVYRIQNATVGDETILDAKDMFHLTGMTDDGIVGMAVITYAARSINLGISQEQYGLGFFANSGVPSGVLEHPQKLSPEAAERLRKEFDENYQGPQKSQDTLVLEEGMTYKSIGLPPEQAQFLASRQHSVEEICRWFGVPPQKVQQLLHSNYNSMEHLAIEVVTDTLMPWIRRFEQEADYKLLNNNWGNVYTRMDLRALMRGTHADRAAFYRTMFGIGALSINEIRDKEEMNPIKDGDMHMIPLNMAPLDKVASGELVTTQRPGSNPPEPTGDSDDEGEDKEPNPAQQTNRRLLRLLDKTLDEIEEFEMGKPYILEHRHDRPN